jgi:hypothetical protein
MPLALPDRGMERIARRQTAVPEHYGLRAVDLQHRDRKHLVHGIDVFLGRSESTSSSFERGSFPTRSEDR